MHPAQAQSVIDVQPAPGSVDVPLDSSIVLTFDVPVEPMTLWQTTVAGAGTFPGSLFWRTGLDPEPIIDTTRMIPTWSEGNTVLTLNYEDDLPGGLEIIWEINNVFAAIKLGAEADILTPIANTSGSFTTAEGCSPDGVPSTFGKLTFNRITSYIQYSSSEPPMLDRPSFVSNIQSPAMDAVTSATVQIPDGTIKSYPSVSGQLLLTEQRNSQEDLEAAWPAGSYTVTMNRELSQASTVDFEMPAAYPPVPGLLNFEAAQSINAAEDFLLKWNAFAGASANDAVHVLIKNSRGETVFEAPDLCVPIDLMSEATSISIPANTLEASQVYDLTLSFRQVYHYSTNSPEQFLTLGAVINSTRLELRVSNGSVIPEPELSGARINAQGQFEFDVGNLVGGASYQVQYKDDATSESEWIPVGQIQPRRDTDTFIDTDFQAAQGSRFYRVLTP
jgi:hypothetical protein